MIHIHYLRLFQIQAQQRANDSLVNRHHGKWASCEVIIYPNIFELYSMSVVVWDRSLISLPQIFTPEADPVYPLRQGGTQYCNNNPVLQSWIAEKGWQGHGRHHTSMLTFQKMFHVAPSFLKILIITGSRLPLRKRRVCCFLRTQLKWWLWHWNWLLFEMRSFDR